MKKFVIATIASFTFISVLFGCSATQEAQEKPANEAQGTSKSQEQPPTNDTEGVSSDNNESSLFYAGEWPQNEVTAAMPVPNFSVGPSDVTTSENTVIVSWDNVSAQEVEAYIQEVKSAGFTYDANESKHSDLYSYHAGNSNDFIGFTNASITYSKDGHLTVNVYNI